MQPRPKLTDVLGLVAMQGQADTVARVGLGLNRATWSDPDLWRACINVVFGKTKMKASNFHFESTSRTRLMQYLDRGRADLVELALGYGADPNLCTTCLHNEKAYTIRTPLQCAIKKKTYSLARLLLEHGADPNQAFARYHHLGSEQTPLELASEEDSFSTVRLLVDEYGAKVPGAFPLGEVVPFAKTPHCLPLASAIRKNNLSMARYFVETKGVRINYPDPERFQWKEDEQQWDEEEEAINDDDLKSYLEDVSWGGRREGRLEIVTYLLNAGAVMDFLDSDDESPLYNAVDMQKMEVVKLMLARGADPNLARSRDEMTCIIAAAENNDLPMVTVLVAAGANVNASINDDDMLSEGMEGMMVEGYTALHHFAEHHNTEGVALMLREGAEIDAVTFSGLTPLLLVAKGVNDDSCCGCIAAACACCRLLVDAGANVDHVRDMPQEFFDVDLMGESESLSGEKKADSFTALTYSTEHNAPALVRCLIELGANVTLCTEHSFSLLMRAAGHGHVEVLETLVKATQALLQTRRASLLGKKYRNAADPDDERNGRNALHFCMMCDNTSDGARCANILIDAGVPVLLRDRRGNKPLDLALQTNSTDIVKMVLVASHLGQAGSVIDINIASWQTTLTVGGVSYSVEVNALCYLVMNGLTNLCARFCRRLTKAQIDQAYKCRAQVECVGSDGVEYFEVRTAHYSALTLALQHSDACAKVLIELGASPLPPSPQSGLPDMSLVNSPLMQAIEKGSGELASLLAVSLCRRGHSSDMLLLAAQFGSEDLATLLLRYAKFCPSHPLDPTESSKQLNPSTSPLIVALRLKNIEMAKIMYKHMNAWQLGLTDGPSDQRTVSLSLDVKVPPFSSPGSMVSISFLGWKFDYRIPDAVVPGQIIRIARTMTWCAPPTSALDVVLRLAAADHSAARKKYLRLASQLLVRGCKLTTSYLGLLIYCAHLGPARDREVFNLVSPFMHFHDWNHGRNVWLAKDRPQESLFEPFDWGRAVRNDWPGAGVEWCRFVGLERWPGAGVEGCRAERW